MLMEFAVTGRREEPRHIPDFLKAWRAGRLTCASCGTGIAPATKLARSGGRCYHEAHSPRAQQKARESSHRVR